MTATNLGKVMILPRQAYDPAATYNILDLVTYNGSSFVALKTVTGVAPTLPPDNVNWQLSASKGDTGDVTPAAQAAAAAALASQQAAANSATSAASSATSAASSDTDASGQAATATTQASIATNAAGTATTQASIATGAATTATTQASIATTQAAAAAASAASVYGDLASTATGKGASLVGFLQPGTGAVARDLQSKAQECRTPFDHGAVGDGVTDDTAALNSFFAYCAANFVVNPDVTGTFAVSNTIYVGPGSGSSVTVRYSGYMKLVAIASMEQMLIVQNCNYARWDGGVYLIGTGGETYASRTCGSGLTLTASLRFTFERIYCQYFNYAGVLAIDSTNKSLSDLGNIQTYDCGSGVASAVLAGITLTANWGTRVDSGSSGSNVQSSAIVVDTLPPANVTGSTYLAVGGKALMARISGTLYYITAINTGTSTLTLFPWIDLTLTTGTLEYVFGGGVVLSGSNTSVLNINQADCQHCGIGVAIGSLYTPIIKRLVTQFCGTAVAYGLSPTSSALGGDLNGVYFESNSEQIAFITRSTAASYGSLTSEYALNLAAVQVVGTPRNTDNSRGTSAGGLPFFRLSYQSAVLQYEKQARNQTELGTITFTIDRRDKHLMLRLNTGTINLGLMSTDLNRLFGYDSGRVILWGTGTGDGPSGSITFSPPAGATVNGTSSAVFSGFNGPAIFSIYWTASTNDFRVSQTSSALIGRATASWTPGAITNGAEVTRTLAVTNAALGNYVKSTLSISLGGCAMSSYVDSAGSTTTTITNNTGSTVTLGAGTLTVRVETQ